LPPSKYVSEVRAKFFEDKHAKENGTGGKKPKTWGGESQFPKPFMIDEAISIAFYYVVERITFEYPLVFKWQKV